MQPALLLLTLGSLLAGSGPTGSKPAPALRPLATVAYRRVPNPSNATLGGTVLTEDGDPLPGATIFVKGTFVGTSTNENGEFLLPVSFGSGPLTLVISFVGFKTQETTLKEPSTQIHISMLFSDEQVSQLVMSASRVEENIQLAPVTVDKVNREELERQSTPEVLNGLAHLKGLDVSSASMLFTSLSTRGFNTAKSERVVQMVDYQDTQLPSLGLSPGNLMGLPELDLESVEVIHGPSSALYGSNALSGVILFTSKDPFLSPGLSVRLHGGQRSLLDAQVRYAKKIGEKLAFKVNASSFRAHDWLAQNFAAAASSANPQGSTLGYDPVNSYGNYGVIFTKDPNRYLPSNVNEELYGKTIYTPGFSEQTLIGNDNVTSCYRLQGAVSYLLKDNLKLTGEAKVAQGTATYQNLSRFRVKGLRTSQYRAELKSPRGFVRLYTTQDYGNRSYELNQLGNLLQEAPSNEGNGRSFAQTYFATYNDVYTQQRQAGATPEAAQQAAQQAANATQLSPTDPRFAALQQSIKDDDVPGRGARQFFSSRLSDASAQYSLPVSDFGTVLTAGAAFRAYRLSSQGKLFSDTTGQAITTSQYGVYGQIIQSLVHDQLKISLAGRFDNFQQFDPAISPRAAAVYSFGPDKRHNFRISYGQAFRAPSSLERYFYEDLGYAVFLGNMQRGFRGYRFRNDQGQALGTTADLSSFQTYLPRLELERVTTAEVGYRGSILPGLYLDASYYRSRYHNFIGAQAILGNLDGTMPTAVQIYQGRPNFDDRSQPTRILFTYFNNTRSVETQGATVALTYSGKRWLMPTVNYSLNLLDRDDLPVGVQSYFNTPKHKFNIGASGTIERFSYQLNYRWAQAHWQEMPFATGNVPAASTTDATLAYQLPKLHATLQAGVSNAFNAPNVQVIGGPQLGRLAFAGFQLELP